MYFNFLKFKHQFADLIGKEVDHFILLNLSSGEAATNLPLTIRAEDET